MTITTTKFLTVLFCTLTFATCFGQTKYEPQILILSPNEMTYDKVFEKEISDYNKQIKKGLKENKDEPKSAEMDNQPENIKTMMQNEIAFAKTLDFSKQISFVAEQYLAYRFFEKFPNLLITLKDIKCNGNISELKKVATEQHFQYLLNFTKINFYTESGISKAKISVQLYDQTSEAILLDKDYIGDWYNQGFEFTCQDSSLSCTINNALAQALPEVIGVVATNSPTLQKEKSLSQQRFNVLINNYYSKPYDTTFISNIILSNDSNINRKSLYQCLVAESKTKFIAFYLEKAVPNDFKSLKDDKKDKNVNIISSKDNKDPGFLDDVPQTYAYIVKGVKYNDKWYYQKSSVTYFESKNDEDGKQKFFNNLQKWDFFKENSTEFNPNFWETNQFQKIKDLTKDPEWNKYGETIWKTDEKENRDYIGMYEIVADELKKIKQNENENFDSIVSSNIFIPIYDAQIKNNPTNFTQYAMLYKKLTLIYSKERKVVLNPIMITNGKGEKALHFFIAFVDTKEIYEWTYFKPKSIPEKTWHYGSEVIDQLKTITEWNFSYSTLDDKNFWDKFVLAKTGDDYKYLKQLK